MAVVTILSVAQVAPRLDPINREAWNYLYRTERIEMSRFEKVPLAYGFPPPEGGRPRPYRPSARRTSLPHRRPHRDRLAMARSPISRSPAGGCYRSPG